MLDLIDELTKLRAEAPEAHLFFAVRYPAGNVKLVEVANAREVVAYADQISYGAARLLTIYALTQGDPEPVVRSYAELEEELEGFRLLSEYLENGCGLDASLQPPPASPWD